MYKTSIHEVREGLHRGISTAKAHLETIKKGFIEELGDAGLTSAGKTLKAYECHSNILPHLIIANIL